MKSKEEGNEISIYNGVHLIKEEVIALLELENIFGEEIPKKGIGFYRSGFVYENQTVTGLSLHKKRLNFNSIACNL